MTGRPAPHALPPADTRETVLDVAEELVLTRGYHGFSYQDVADRVGIRKASVHHHFATKEGLAVALVARARERALQRAAAGPRSPRERLEAQFAYFARLLEARGRICFGGSLAAELEALPPRLRAELDGLTVDRLQLLTALFREGQRDGTFRGEAAPEAQAALVAAALQGALQIARVRGAPALYASTVDELRRLLYA